MSDLTLFDLPRLLGYQFFQYAIIGGVIAAFVCAWVGLFLVLRREAMIGDGIAHTAFGGIAVGLWAGIDPVLSALIVSVLATLGISYMRRKGLAQSDAAIAVMLAIGFSLGLVVISIAGGFNVELFSFLFGSILTVDRSDLLVVGSLGGVTALFLGLFYKELLAVTFDEEASRLMGLPVNTLSIAFNVLVALAIVLSIKIIGMILVVAILVLPGLSALQLRLSFRNTTRASVCFGILSMTVGLSLSAVYNVAASGVIVFTAAAIFLCAAVFGRLE
jgi:zinc transport system permease protein